MRIDGAWLLCDDGQVRPILRGRIQTAAQTWYGVSFLADTGADCTVLCAEVLDKLGLPRVARPKQLGGVGGNANTVQVETMVQLIRESGEMANFMGKFVAFTESTALDMSVLARDITNHFALIVDRPRDVVCLIGQGHRYEIAEG